ncbi:hypothetical protein FisN_13Hh124 [Fistulifera solaris]|uniref:Palmitoyltransferase n=1 Tax=Fistulifera solaris TaxID=1519565 RepID=A0A1Z5KN65_FISSO|nr:hypothetical protein FisN_13Hh124 [Fistulifera solaris]|eukprot:GAX27773.1 hypothetical protein FisN_13Hh124 [Fistulifera solaris]
MKRRRNGFSTPYSVPQIAAWIALVLSFLEFILFVSPLMPLEISIPVTIYFVALIVGVVYFGSRTQLMDPIDLHLFNDLRALSQEDSTNNASDYFHITGKCLPQLYQRLNPEITSLPEEEMKQCWICETMVADHSMHCKFCNKCVYHFDHHCMWLNTCVGSHNYKDFFRTMCFIFAMEVSHFVIHLVLLIMSFVDDSDIADDWIVDGFAELVYAVLLFFALFNVVSILLIGQLLQFHVGLQRDGITTYQYIVRDHKRKRERLRLEDELRGQRTQKIVAAREQGKLLEVMRLRIGDQCRSAGCEMCDPLTLPEPNPEPDPEAGFAAALGTGANAGDDESDDGLDVRNADADAGRNSTNAYADNEAFSNGSGKSEHDSGDNERDDGANGFSLANENVASPYEEDTS